MITTRPDRAPKLLVLLALVCAAACNDAARGPWGRWTRLRLDVKDVPLVSGTVELRVREGDGKTRFETRSVASLLGATVAEAQTTSVLDASNGRSELHESRSAGSARRYLFGERSYEVQRLSADGDPERPLDEWSVTERREFPYPPEAPRAALDVHDYYAALFRLHELDLHGPGDEARIWVATPRGPAEYRVLATDVRSSSRELRDPRSGAIRAVELTELRLRIVPSDPARTAEGFLRTEGEIEIWVERDSKTLVELVGTVAGMRVRLVVTEMD